MSLINQLESLLGITIDVSKLKSINFSVLNGNSFKLEKKSLTINIQASEFDDPKALAKLQAAIRSFQQEDGSLILEAEASKRLEEIGSSHQYDDVLVFFSDKIPTSDVPILRAALYIRSRHEAGEHVDSMKRDLVARYGTRASNISNLCTAGYFESYFMPMYEELCTRPNFTPQVFIDNYELIIDKAPFAVFVSSAKDGEVLEAEIVGKIRTNRGYGIHQLNVHAIGVDNVRKLREVIERISIVEYFTSEPEISIQGNVMNVQLFF